MRVVVGSKNGPKGRAVKAAFRKMYPRDTIELEAVTADSGVSDHPTDGSESLNGAINRAKHARQLQPEADFYVGIEGGLISVDGRTWEISWVAIENREGQVATALSPGLELRGKLLEAILAGKELGIAFAEQHGVRDAGKKNGLYGMATDDIITRESATVDAVVFALARFKHPEYFE